MPIIAVSSAQRRFLPIIVASSVPVVAVCRSAAAPAQAANMVSRVVVGLGEATAPWVGCSTSALNGR
jgi:hypothetical protein